MAEPSRTEGDINLSDARRDWQAKNLSQETKAKLEEDGKYFLHQSLSTPCLNVLKGCENIYIIDDQGRRLMDFHGNSVHQVGYSHPDVIQAMKQQLDELSFCPRRFINDKSTLLAKKLVELAPGKLKNNSRVLFTPSGACSIGIALKIIRYATGRFKTISMWDAFHGATLDAISIGGESLFRKDLGPLLPGCHHVLPYQPGEDPIVAAERVVHVLRTEGDVAAVIAEPLRCTTVVIPPAEYWRHIRKACDDHNALLVYDEIPVCLGRTGKMFAAEHFEGADPDILVIGKGLGGSMMPMSACIAREDLNVAGDRALGHYTHEKSPLGCAAALATIGVIESNNLVQHAVDLGAKALTTMQGIRERHPIVADVRGVGFQLAIEMRCPKTGEKAVSEAERVLYRCLELGLSFKISDGCVLTLAPPLVITEEQLMEALRIVEQAIGESPPAS